MDFSDLQVKGLTSLSLQDISSDQALVRIEELSQDEQYLSEPMSAREFYESLYEVLKNYAVQINGTEAYIRLQKVLIRLMWHALPALEKSVKAQILSKNLLFALSNQVEVLANIDAYLYLFEYGVGPDMEERRILSRSLDLNQERLGAKPVQLKSIGDTSPTLNNWIKDFVSYYNPTAYKGESYELTHYLYSSPNVKNLSPEEKQVLARVISIYLHLRHPNYVPKIIGQPGQETVKPLPRVLVPTKTQTFEKPMGIPAQKITPPPATITTQIGDKSQLDQKLVKAVVPHGASLSSLKARIAERNVAEQQALSKKTPDLTPEEIKREVSTPELPAHQVQNIGPRPVPMKARMIAKPPVAQPIPPRPIPASPAKVSFATPKMSVANINVVDDLKKLDVTSLREGDLADQVRLIRNKISSLTAAGNLLPFYTVQAYEQSPLFRAYLLHGSDRVAGTAANADLTQEEFEALADLRKELGHL